MVWFWKKKEKPVVSIVIPAYNEEKYIPKLLEALKSQTFKNFEVIVSDNNSEDKTIQMAKKHSRGLNFKVVVCKERGPGANRNFGAKLAEGDYIMFLDADVLPNKNFIKRCLKEFEDRYLDIATCHITFGSKKYKVFEDITNFVVNISKHIVPIGRGGCLLITKRLHKRIGGFNRHIKLGEDVDYVMRASIFGRYGFFKEKLKVSPRRLNKEGMLAVLNKYAVAGLKHIIGEKVTYNDKDISYEFGNNE